MAEFADALANLKTELDNLVAERLALSTNPKPFYIIDRQHMSAVEYRRFLSQQIEDTYRQILLLQGPYRNQRFMRPV